MIRFGKKHQKTHNKGRWKKTNPGQRVNVTESNPDKAPYIHTHTASLSPADGSWAASLILLQKDQIIRHLNWSLKTLISKMPLFVSHIVLDEAIHVLGIGDQFHIYQRRCEDCYWFCVVFCHYECSFIIVTNSQKAIYEIKWVLIGFIQALVGCIHSTDRGPRFGQALLSVSEGIVIFHSNECKNGRSPLVLYLHAAGQRYKESNEEQS